MHLPQYKLCARRAKLAFEMKFHLNFHRVSWPRRRTLTNGSDVKYRGVEATMRARVCVKQLESNWAVLMEIPFFFAVKFKQFKENSTSYFNILCMWNCCLWNCEACSGGREDVDWLWRHKRTLLDQSEVSHCEVLQNPRQFGFVVEDVDPRVKETRISGISLVLRAFEWY